jgi:peptide chain release factor 1
MVPLDKLDQITRRFEFLEASLSSGARHQEIATLSKEYSDLKIVVQEIFSYKRALIDLTEVEEMLADPYMRTLAEEEMPRLKTQLSLIEKALRLALLPKDAADARPAIMEIRPGTGGDEAALFAANLFRMYHRYAEQKNWKFIPIDINETGIGGYKEASANITGKGVFARLKFESGVHRVQRVPETESQGRVHTSAATVAVLPEAEEVDIQIDLKDLRVDTYRAQGAGGQHVNKTDSAIRITHIPTNIVVQCQEGKSQHKNRAQAMKMLRSKLYETEREDKDSARASDRKNQVGSGDRSERIRTYNYPQGRVTDHRINLTLYKLDKALEGDLDEVINALLAEDQATRLAEIT